MKSRTKMAKRLVLELSKKEAAYLAGILAHVSAHRFAYHCLAEIEAFLGVDGKYAETFERTTEYGLRYTGDVK